jgi:hypothetical protein
MGMQENLLCGQFGKKEQSGRSGWRSRFFSLLLSEPPSRSLK